jgi:hypothetical protein
VILKRELSLDNFAGDIELEITDIAPVELVYINQLVLVTAWKDGQNQKGHYRAYAIPDGCIAHPSADIVPKFGTGISGSMDRTFATAIEVVETK